MRQAKIIRCESSPDYGTLGVLLLDGVIMGVTLENYYFGNEKNISCIPTGRYLCENVNSPKFGNTYEVIGVYNRDKILFHWGNTEQDTEGCILIGSREGYLKGLRAVLDSKSAFGQFMQALNNSKYFMLTIQEVY